MNHGSLFSGIGGFDLAAQWMGWNNLFHCEWNEFGQKVLKYYWPNAKSYHDITKSTFTEFRGRIDILTGGFPCQPFSTAGKRQGTEDNRYLWPEMLRVIREVKPRYIVGENVRGLVNWNGGMVFEQVCSDLEAEGYEILPILLPACSVNAPHRRYRIWFIAYSNNERRSNGLGQIQGNNAEISKRNNNAESCDSDKFNATDSKDSGCISNEEINKWEECKSFYRNEIRIIPNSDGSESNATNSNGIGQRRESNRKGKNDWQTFPTVPPVCNGNDGLSDRLDGITFSKWRKESIKAGGNAIVPQVAFEIFKVIEQLNQKP